MKHPKKLILALAFAAILYLPGCSKPEVAADHSQSQHILNALGVHVSSIELPEETTLALFVEFEGEEPQEVCSAPGKVFQVGVSYPKDSPSIDLVLSGGVGTVSGKIDGNPFRGSGKGMISDPKPRANLKGEFVILSAQSNGKVTDRIYLRAKEKR